MKEYFAVIFLGFVLLVVTIARRRKNKQLGIDSGESDLHVLKSPVAKRTINDKIVLLKNAKHEDVRKALSDFSKMYNSKESPFAISLHRNDIDEFVLSFPSDLDFDTFCFLINYLKYPRNVQWNAETYGWTKMPLQNGESYLEQAEKAMIFVPDNELEFDNVYITTETGEGYRNDFAEKGKLEKLDVPVVKFANPPLNTEELPRWNQESFE